MAQTPGGDRGEAQDTEEVGKDPGLLVQSAPICARRAERKTAAALAALATVSIYLLTFSSVPVTNIDDQLMLTSAMSFVQTGKFLAPSRFATKKIGGQYFGKKAVSGEVIAKYPVGYPLVLSLFIVIATLAGNLLGSVAAEVVLCLPSMLAILASMALIWRSALRLGLRAKTALCVACGLGLGSLLWPYAGINWSEPCQVLCITASLYCLLSAWQEDLHWKKGSSAKFVGELEPKAGG